jgi:UDP-N-acetylglucosamine/UDP-N-acetylgalactosamine 4-epimerase
MLEGKKILVTGGAGFIGSNLCEFLVANNEVICLDNLITGKKENIQHLMDNSKFEFLEVDIRDFEACQKAVKGIDIIFHQAALGSVPRSIKTPLNTNEHNITGFLNVLEAARQEEVKRFVYASSSSTYGDHPQLPKVEEEIGNPLSPYSVTKLVNELYAGLYSKLYGIETIGLRYFNVFGPRQDPNGAYAAVIPRFIKYLRLGEQITINGDGEQTRDFTYIDNVIQANVLAATVQDEEALNTVYNIAYGSSISLNGLIRILQEGFKNNQISHADFKVVHGQKRVGDIEHSFASVEKAKAKLGYQPKCTLEQGIDNYLKYLVEHE